MTFARDMHTLFFSLILSRAFVDTRPADIQASRTCRARNGYTFCSSTAAEFALYRVSGLCKESEGAKNELTAILTLPKNCLVLFFVGSPLTMSVLSASADTVFQVQRKIERAGGLENKDCERFIIYCRASMKMIRVTQARYKRTNY